MNVEKILEEIYHVNFEKQHDLTKTFLRFQEYYESPKFRGKIFTLNEFRDWYVKNSERGKETGEFTYYDDWTGFNIPSFVLAPFYRGDFPELSKNEENLLAEFFDKQGDEFYIIGTYGNREEDLKHQISHGLYYTNQQYKKDILKAIKQIDLETRQKIRAIMEASAGYHESVFFDELQAHLLVEREWVVQDAGVSEEQYEEYSGLIKTVFDKYCKYPKK